MATVSASKCETQPLCHCMQHNVFRLCTRIKRRTARAVERISKWMEAKSQPNNWNIAVMGQPIINVACNRCCFFLFKDAGGTKGESSVRVCVCVCAREKSNGEQHRGIVFMNLQIYKLYVSFTDQWLEKQWNPTARSFSSPPAELIMHCAELSHKYYTGEIKLRSLCCSLYCIFNWLCIKMYHFMMVTI